MIITTSLALLLTASVSSSAAVAPVGQVCEAVWRDASRERDIPIRIRLPQGSASAPLVLFSHGLGGSLDAGTTWAKAWETEGIAVIHLQHPGSDAALWAGETTGKGRLAAVRKAMNGQQLLARVADVTFILDEVARRASRAPTDACDLRRIDLQRIGMAGHSFGAATTQAIAGQRFGGRSRADVRVKAAIAFSPTVPQRGDDAHAFGTIKIPFMSVTGTLDTNPRGLNDVAPADRVRPFAAMPAGEKYLAVFDGGDHQVFGGRGIRRAARSDDDRIIAATSKLTTLFWRKALTGASKLSIDRQTVGMVAADSFSFK